MFRERSEEIKFSLIVIDFCCTLAAYAVAFMVRFYVLNPDFSDLSKIDFVSYTFFGVLLSICQVIVFSLLNLYSPRRFLSFLDEVGGIFAGVVLNIILSVSILYFLKIYEVSRILPFIYGIATLVFIVFAHNLFRNVVIRRRTQGKDLRDVLIIGANASALRASTVVEQNKLFGLHVVGFVLEDKETADLIGDRALGTIADLDEIMTRVRPSYIIYAGQSDYHENLKLVLNTCDAHGIHLQIVPSYSELITANGRIENYDGLPIISIRDIPSRIGINRILKRSFDIVFSTIFIALFLPLYIVVALAVKLTSKGPIFFAQERVGLDNKVFRILKFRTMKVQEVQASATIWTKKDDPRITPIGKFLRKTSLDEIPQFFNILLGQMSVVGPRPERPYFVEQFKDKYKYFKRRHAVKAGLTGWAQINGFRGDTSIQDRIDADIFYIENWSFFLDLKIVFLTPFKGMFSKNAY